MFPAGAAAGSVGESWDARRAKAWTGDCIECSPADGNRFVRTILSFGTLPAAGGTVKRANCHSERSACPEERSEGNSGNCREHQAMRSSHSRVGEGAIAQAGDAD